MPLSIDTATCLELRNLQSSNSTTHLPNALPSPVQAKAEGWFVFPHLPSDIVTASQLIAEAVARGVQHNAAHTAQRLSRQELHLGIWVIGLHQTSRMHLAALEKYN